jgi:glycerol uptake facilitator-like aquaporin
MSAWKNASSFGFGSGAKAAAKSVAKTAAHVAESTTSETAHLVSGSVAAASKLTDAVMDEASSFLATGAAAGDESANVRTSEYWTKLQAFKSDDFDACSLSGKMYGQVKNHLWADMVHVWINEFIASFVWAFVMFQLLTVMHESQQEGAVLTSYLSAFGIVGAAYAINWVCPGVHMNPNITLLQLLRECTFEFPQYVVPPSGSHSQLEADSCKEHRGWRLARCCMRAIVQMGCQVVGFLLAAIAVYYSDYMRHLHRVAQANSLLTLPASVFLNLGQTVPNEQLEIGKWNAWGLEFAATFFLLFAIARAIEIETKTIMDNQPDHLRSISRVRHSGRSKTVWSNLYTRTPVLVVLGLDLAVLGPITGASMNWARSFGPAWYAYNQRKTDEMAISDADPYAGLRHLWGYMVAQTIAVVAVVLIFWMSLLIARKKLMNRKNITTLDVDNLCAQLNDEDNQKTR